MDERIKALEAKFAEFETRLAALEAFTGVKDWDADSTGSSLHRRLDYLEDWRRDSYDGG